MANEIISYLEMCTREGASLQRGMNFGIGGNYSVILMSVAPNAPYPDRFEDDETTIIYEGHDRPRSKDTPLPKALDQPERTPSGLLTQNGKFHQAATSYKEGLSHPARVKVYEKIKQGIWSYAGLFELIDSWREECGGRRVFKFRLTATNEDSHLSSPTIHPSPPRRLIPTGVKLAVWKRDGGKCVKCGATDNLHFDHIIPFSKGGSSNTPENIQLLCAKHNLEKHDKIE